jgi:hypothetical protein
MIAAPRTAYHFAVLRVVPHVHLGAFVNVGVVVHARTAEFLGLRAVTDPDALGRMVGQCDIDLLVRYLECYRGICEGEPSAGPIALLSRSERFHWLTAPRSDVLQASPVHEGLCDDPARALDELFSKLIV